MEDFVSEISPVNFKL